MSILIASQTAAATSDGHWIEDKVVVAVSSGIALGEDCAIEIKSDIDSWIETGEILSASEPVVVLEGPAVYRFSKPSSASAYGVEMRQNIASDTA